MPTEIEPSSYQCACGHVAHFHENTIKEVKASSHKKRQWLAEGGNRETEHVIIFQDGRMADILCPEEGTREAAKHKFTPKQGQYLAFLHQYTKLHRQTPAEHEMQLHFNVSPPSVHQMVMTSEKQGLIERTPGQARSIKLLVPVDLLPRL